MSKMVELQVAKSEQLLQGFRKNLSELSQKGVTSAQLDAMEQQVASLVRADQHCESLRQQLSEAVREMNEQLAATKAAYVEKKRIVKGFYEPTQWNRFGVPDKR